MHGAPLESGDTVVMAAPEQTHYDVLGLARDSDASEIRAAWKLHVQVWHPDRFDGEMREHAEQRAARINEAYTTLRDGSRRAAYDCRLAADERDVERVRAASAPPPPSRRSIRRDTQQTAPAATATAAATATHQTGLSYHLDALASELASSARLHPRLLVAAIIAVTLALGGGILMQALSGPRLPASQLSASIRSTQPRPDLDAVDLDALARQSRSEAASAEAELTRLLQQDDVATRAAEAADAAAQARAQQQASTAAPSPRSGGRVVRIMPRSAQPIE